jgi:hypothetical protein
VIGGVVVKAVAVRFQTGQDVLNAYWGYLADGGLVIPNLFDVDVDEGEAVALRIHIESLDTDYAMEGRLVRRQPSGAHAVVAFNPGEPHDMLLSAVLAETDDVPPREHRRYACDLPAELASPSAAGAVPCRVVNVSEVGCCIRLGVHEGRPLPPGTANVRIVADRFDATGRVVWARQADRGVQFEINGTGTPAAVRALIESL